MNIGNAIKICRSHRGLTQKQLADQSHISVSYLSLLEKGKRDPNFSKIREIAKALRVPLNVLVFLASSKEDLAGFSDEIIEKLSGNILSLLSEEEHDCL